MQEDAHIKQPPQLFVETQKILSQLSSILDAPVITYWNSSRGSICANDVLAIYQFILVYKK
jgi:hypothetical protein